MPYCNTCQKVRDGNFCSECGENFAADGLRFKSHDIVINNGPGQQTVVVCALCGKKLPVTETFDCVKCGKKDLCLSHFDAKYKRCEDCAALARGDGAKKVEREQAREKELAAWRARAEHAEAEARGLKEKLNQQETRAAVPAPPARPRNPAEAAQRSLAFILIACLLITVFTTGLIALIQKPNKESAAARLAVAALQTETLTPSTTPGPMPTRAPTDTVPPTATPTRAPTVTPTRAAPVDRATVQPRPVVPPSSSTSTTQVSRTPITTGTSSVEVTIADPWNTATYYGMIALKPENDIRQTFIPSSSTIKDISIGLGTLDQAKSANVQITMELLSGDTVLGTSSVDLMAGFNEWIMWTWAGDGIAVTPGQALSIKVSATKGGILGWKFSGDNYPQGEMIVDGKRQNSLDCLFIVSD